MRGKVVEKRMFSAHAKKESLLLLLLKNVISCLVLTFIHLQSHTHLQNVGVFRTKFYFAMTRNR